MEVNRNINFSKYFFVFFITAIVFGTALYFSNFFGQKKIEEVKNIQDKISIDILSSETQFSLLEDSSCKNIGSKTLSGELSSLEEKLSATANERGEDDPDVLALKRYYSLLEIKNYVLTNKIASKCKDTKIVSILYFYSNKNCTDCQKEGYVLTRLRELYPNLRVYSFDYNLDLSAVKTLISINKITDNLPALVIKDETYYGFQSVEDIQKVLPELSATSTSTKK